MWDNLSAPDFLVSFFEGGKEVNPFLDFMPGILKQGCASVSLNALQASREMEIFRKVEPDEKLIDWIAATC